MSQKTYLQISIAVIFLALIIAFLIIQRPNFYNENKISESKNNNISENNVVKNFNLEKTNTKLTADILNFKDIPEDNLTEKISAELTNSIIQLNKENDLSSGQLQVPNEELFSDEIFQKYKVNFWKNLKLTTINELKLGKEDPPESSLQYFIDVNQIIYDNKLTEDIYQEGLQSFIDNEAIDFIKDLINKLDKGISDLKNLVIPSSYANIHLDLINFMNMKKAVLFDLYNYSNDPLRALAAIQFLEEIDTYYQNWMINLTKKMEKDGALNYFKF